MNKIVAFFDKGDPALKLTRLALDKLNARFSLSLELEVLPAICGKLEAMHAAKNAGAVLVGPPETERGMAAALQEELDLHTSLRAGEIQLVTNSASGIYGDKSGYTEDATFGRAAYDVEYFSELEIERVARIAYEFAAQEDKGVLLLDRGGRLATSQLWRKIVSDINEDYPSVPLKMCDICNFLPHFDKISRTLALDGEQLSLDKNLILSSRLFGDIAWSAMDDDGFEAYFGDSSLALYVPIVCSSNLILALPHMLKHCFSLDAASSALAACFAPLTRDSLPKDFESALSIF